MSNQIIAALIAFIIVAILSPLLITVLRKLRLIQPIRKELPSDHQLKKGTPLMFGMILFIGIIVAIAFSPTPLMYFLSIIYFLFSFVGFLDDFWKASRQDPGGVSGKTKLIFQFLFTGTLLFYVINELGIDTSINIYKNISLELPMIFYVTVITLFVVGSANAINFTDGLDGLLGVVAIPTYFFFFVVSDKPEVQIFCLIMIGCLLGFLIYNIYPAKAFMGDTGSLAIGGSLSFLAVIEKVEILIPILFFIYFAEQLSVILQVASFKLTDKRIFRMTPIHYHFSLKYGWSENTIVSVFGFISWFCAFICLAYWRFLLNP
ncbi:phospho-N-acetylmuramoyl-pentapeptide-transferase [Caldibacillus lycopersici]|uniref:Phospho-N-acetylmuramoyl-pentapeptide-transferase n=1 Tax=Perspicuibacillus lycopersici TaxID=1325689 RepID=A0AAE3LPI0_9BACI|nr:phospho-N-acetylmuramoyl-pentapeptide-transferase [Perspicuibacillus lycopersici]MCU9614996.1 phospho-N-acetylmuramoyl-pentapeptide-transferase [Perspicuibacillus lycopersici]